jgi:Cysteine-rich CWC
MNQDGSGIDPNRCPLCGEGNECGIAAGSERCWCFSAIIPEDVLGSVPEQARDAVCICQKCAKQEADSRKDEVSI